MGFRYPANIWRKYTTYIDGGKSHSNGAIDIPFPAGTPLYSPCDGVVTYAGWENGGGGNVVIVRPDNESVGICYAHMATINVSVGQRVSLNSVVGSVGATGNATGPHLHEEVRVNGNNWGRWFPVVTYFAARGVNFNNPDPTPKPTPNSEDEEMRNAGIYWQDGTNTFIYAVFNTVSGFWSEFTNGEGKGPMPSDYNNALAGALNTPSWAKVTKSHAHVLKRDCLAVRAK